MSQILRFAESALSRRPATISRRPPGGIRFLPLRRCSLVLAGFVSLSVLPAASGQEAGQGGDPGPKRRIDFNLDVRPLLSDACFACHGPDEKKREIDLRLDTRAGAFVDLGGYAAIVPGKPEESSLYQRLVAEDEDERMPPPESGKSLTPKQVELIRRWIAEGADYREHWAFEPPVRSTLPRIAPDDDATEGPTVVDWPRNEIDHFILARLQQEGLTPSREAAKEALIRRVTFDLTGLPPTLQEVDEFLQDESADAYERVVDRLLKSPRYGEHMARFWLDAARYGDTHGLHLDNYREMWPYRDWVINAFNANLPFDQFTIEQLAGDLLPEATLDQIVATGFNRCHVTTNEGGTIPEEFYVRNVVDRVETTGQVFMGLTLGCAVCHEHKYDPITQTEFYQLFAFFNNIDGSPMDGNVKDHAPFVYVPTEEQQQTRREIHSRRAETERQRAAREQTSASAFAAWTAWQRELLTAGSDVVLQSVDPEGLVVHLPLDESSGDKAANSLDEKKPAVVTGASGWTAGQRGGAFQFTDKDSSINVGSVAAFAKADSFSFGAWLKTPGDVNGSAIAKMDQARNTGYELHVDNRRVDAILARSFPDLAIHVRTETDVLAPNSWHHVFITYDGSQRATGVAIYVDGRRQAVEIKADQLGKYDFKTGKPLLLGRRDKTSPFSGGAIDDVRIYDRRLTEPEVAQIALAAEMKPLLALEPEKRTGMQTQRLRTFYLTQYDSVYRGLAARSQKLSEEEAELNKQMPTTLVFRERKEVRPAYLLERGEYDRKGEQTERITPAVFPPLPDDQPRDRLGLARWLVSSGHPLTARVTVNRFWQQVFGTGLVKTSEDFGSQGEPPSHPKLLDWMAVDFRENGWDVKRLMKSFVMSSTYRQTSRVRQPELISEIDPDNRLYARGPRYRLDAEMLRDQALSLSGLLVDQLGGPSVKPPQPDGLWFAVGYSGSNTVRFEADDGPENVHRRTLYTFIKRTAPPPQMSTFDAPSREACSLRRERTNTPLQALLLLNDPQFFEAALGLAQRTMREGGASPEDRAAWMFRHCTSRRPDQRTIEELVTLLNDETAAYTGNQEAAQRMVAVGTTPLDESLDPVELAAWTMVANIVLNLDEVVTKN